MDPATGDVGTIDPQTAMTQQNAVLRFYISG